MPAKSTYDNNTTTNYRGPSIWMETNDHRQTASHGNQGLEGAAYRDQQAAYIANKEFYRAMEMDIDDIQGKFGDRYDESMINAINEAKNQELISEEEAAYLESKCKNSQ